MPPPDPCVNVRVFAEKFVGLKVHDTEQKLLPAAVIVRVSPAKENDGLPLENVGVVQIRCRVIVKLVIVNRGYSDPTFRTVQSG